MMRPAAELRTAQRLNITPQLRHAIGLLQLSTPELEQRLREALDSNVFLEADDPEDTGSSAGAPFGIGEGSREAGSPESELAAPEPDLKQHLIRQLIESNLSERDRVLAHLIIDALDDDGYLMVALDDLTGPDAGISVDSAELEAVRCTIQNLEPVGCASTDLGDCLRAQLRGRRLEDGLSSIIRRLTRQEPADWLQPPEQLATRIGCTDSQIVRALGMIRSLDPYPGRRVSAAQDTSVVPDVLVSRREGRWVVRLNGRILPSIRMNRAYETLMTSARCESHSAIHGQLQEARWLVKSVHMRNQTLLRVAGAIVARQQPFLERGEIAMRPMVLVDVAGEIGMHESTVSRVTTRKYIHTPRGLFELKFFFSSRLSTRGGGRCSSTAVRALIRALVEAENPTRPLSDSAIARLMSEKGVRIARRTVAKYRESLAIPPLEQRLVRTRSGRGSGARAARPGAGG